MNDVGRQVDPKHRNVFHADLGADKQGGFGHEFEQNARATSTSRLRSLWHFSCYLPNQSVGREFGNDISRRGAVQAQLAGKIRAAQALICKDRLKRGDSVGLSNAPG
jgi:hypothetical protein